MQLYYSPASPYVRKVTIIVAEHALGARVERVPGAVSPVVRNEEIARSNPMIKLPTLLLDDGTALYDSATICEYMDHLSGAPRFFPPAGPARWNALRRHALGDGLLDAAILLRYEMAVRPEALRWPEWIAGQTGKITGALDMMEAEAAFYGTGFDIGHITTACALGYLDVRFDNLQWRTGRPGLAAWFAAVSERPSVKATVPVV